MTDLEKEELRQSMAAAHRQALQAQDAVHTQRTQDKEDAVKLKELTTDLKKATQGSLSPLFSIAMNWRNPQQVLMGFASMVMGGAQSITAASNVYLHQQDMAARRKAPGAGFVFENNQ